jgi:hypothetical protein
MQPWQKIAVDFGPAAFFLTANFLLVEISN